jgi:NAD(P)-dependent dehydrogenase (short-subunit alcohol dehydrogenase family)
MADLSSKAALVRGAQPGIDKAIAVALAREGADVAINYLDDQTMATETATSGRALGRRAEGRAVGDRHDRN